MHFAPQRRGRIGVVAQLVERLVRNEKVAGSNPVGSTTAHLALTSDLHPDGFGLHSEAGRGRALLPSTPSGLAFTASESFTSTLNAHVFFGSITAM